MGWRGSSSLRATSTASVAVEEELQIYRELGGGGVENPGKKLKEKLGAKSGEELSYKSENLALCQANGCANPIPKTQADQVRGVVLTVGKGLGSLARVVSSCCSSSLPRLTLASPDDSEDDEERLLYPESSLVLSFVHVTLVKLKNLVGVSGYVSCCGDGVEDDPADSLPVVTAVHTQVSITTQLAEVLAPASEAVVEEVAREAATSVDLGSLEDPIKVGLLTGVDYGLIVHAICPSLG